MASAGRCPVAADGEAVPQAADGGAGPSRGGAAERAGRQARGSARQGSPSSVSASGRAATDALRQSPGWKGQLRRRIGALSWDRIAGCPPPKDCLAGRGPSGRA